MIGTFRTYQYVDRYAYERGAADRVVVARNRFTNAGLAWFWEQALGSGVQWDVDNDELQSGRIVVGNGDRGFDGSDTALAGDLVAVAEMEPGYPEHIGMRTADDGVAGYGVRFCAVFGERDAIFDWRERGVVTAGGVLIDRSVGDQGRKVLGSVWRVEAELELTQ